eukprot:CAMPEP_0119043904 /NCGR_PEP_ID=MMETSP1177-20130426/26783_1 /TAXON_ID=2985 /ORGANISM="Ochromonas sp, Strain CCMP1899" /LENGTH=131 /DNA_ID=CAMNT_0007012999 /DNA_START=582 /DNA_END=977 /DNA_ORIENTATION=+
MSLGDSKDSKKSSGDSISSDITDIDRDAEIDIRRSSLQQLDKDITTKLDLENGGKFDKYSTNEDPLSDSPPPFSERSNGLKEATPERSSNDIRCDSEVSPHDGEGSEDTLDDLRKFLESGSFFAESNRHKK